jgi:hypothetical protein
MIPLWLKLAWTLPAVAIIVVYWRRYGPGNLLWFSDIALILSIPAVWLESAVLAGAAAVLVLVPEVAWNIGFFGRLLTGRRLGGIVDYMFEPDRPRLLKALSLFHVPLPLFLVWLVWQLGYDARALPLAIALTWLVIPVTRLVTRPERNVNWVFGPPRHRELLHPVLFVGFLMLAMPLLFHLPAHLLLDHAFG